MNGLITDPYTPWNLQDVIERTRNHERLRKRLQSAKPMMSSQNKAYIDKLKQQQRKASKFAHSKRSVLSYNSNTMTVNSGK